ncbi:hypothetical protein L0222_11410 [bacterium]|nr:hypothetical protein [bacterium]MCI0606437.1 hypothetical protein [bacterium]
MTSFNVSATFPVSNLSIKRNAATIVLQSGEITLIEPLHGRHHAALFTGQGVFHFRPPNALEQDQLHKFTNTRILEEPFHTAVLRFSDTTSQELLQAKAGDARAKTARCDRCQEVKNKILKRYLRNVDSRILRDIHSEKSGYLAAYFFSKSKGEFLLEIDPEQSEQISLTQHAKMDFVDVWSSFETEETKNTEEITIPYFEARMDIEKDGKLQATATIEILPTTDLKSIPLNFSRLMELEEITDDRGKSAFFIYETAEDKVGEPPLKQDTLDLFLSEVFLRGEKRKLKFVYRSDHMIERVGNREDYVILDTTGWYPTYGYLTRSSSKVQYCYPRSLQLFAVGKKLKEWSEQEKNCSEWEQKTPVAIVSFSLGDFKHKNVKVEGLPPADIFSGKHHSGFRIGGGGLDNVAADVVNSLNFFQTLYAPYPFDNILATEIPAAHGQGFPGFLHLSGVTFEDVRLAGIDEAFRAHEVSHQWWGHLVGWESYHDQWISEGFAEFSGAIYADAAHPRKDLLMKIVESWKDDVLNRGTVRRQTYGAMKLRGELTMGTESGPIWLGIRLSSSKSPADYHLLVYQKGAYVLHMLRMMMKDFQTNSDERFFQMMKDFVKTYSWKNATTEGFQEIAEKHYGESLKWFFDQWVYGTRVPKYEFRWKVEPAEGNKYVLICDIQQKNVPDGFQMPVPIYLDFGKDRFAIQRILVDEPVKNVRIPLPEKPRDVRFNFQRAVLCYD